MVRLKPFQILADAGKIADIDGKFWLTCAHDFM